MLKHKKQSKNILIFSGLALTILIGGLLTLYALRTNDSSDKNTSEQSSDIAKTTPATDEDQQYSNKFKESQGDPSSSSTSSNSPNGSKVIKPIVVDAGKYGDGVEARAYIPGIVEDGGVCTFAFTGSNGSITKQTAAVADATTTRCTNLRVSGSEFERGAWELTIAYQSANAQGTSDSFKFEVN